MQHPCQLEPFQVIAVNLLEIFQRAVKHEGLYTGISRSAFPSKLVVCLMDPETFRERQHYIEVQDATRTVLSGVVGMCPEGLICHAVTLAAIQEASLMAERLMAARELDSKGEA